MADICVVYLSEDEAIVNRLVACLRQDWTVWWAPDLTHGDWDQAVRNEIRNSRAVVLLSQHVKGERTTIIKDEMRFARIEKKPIFPFLIGSADVPLGFGDLTHTEALGWAGDEGHPGYQKLKAKIVATIGNGHRIPDAMARPRELKVREKTLRLPAFVFSLSSHETQVTPREGATLLRLLEPDAALVSAYDAWQYRNDRAKPTLRSSVEELRRSATVLFLDSGNYEAYRKNDSYSSRRNPKGWQVPLFRKMAAGASPDLGFSFDDVRPKGEPARIADRIVAGFRADERALGRAFPLCPVVHLPSAEDRTIASLAPKIVSSVAAATDPIMVAIPERELGDGLLERARTVRAIREALNAIGKYYPLHLLGTGNPVSMIALAAAGADGFDGLEWCRTVADYATGFLFHFQQFDCFVQTHLHRIQDQKIRRLVENPVVSYAMRTLSYNVDFFKDWTRTMQSMIHSGQAETLLKMVPGIGPALFKVLSE